MSTTYETSAAAKRARRVRRKYKRILSTMLTTSLVVGTAGVAYSMHLNSVRALKTDISILELQVSELASENQVLDAALRESEHKLSIFVDTTEVRAAEPTIYNIDLSEDLQEYTYNMCLNYGIVDHYEIVLAMMWQESNYRADLISSTNDYGIMQINKCNHEWLSETLGITDFLDAKQNINAGTYIISKLLHKYDNEHEALMAYNMGEGGAARCWEQGIYSSHYSRAIMSKHSTIVSNNYNTN